VPALRKSCGPQVQGWLLLETGVHVVMMLLALLVLWVFMLCWLVLAQRWRLQSTRRMLVFRKGRSRRIKPSVACMAA
jgi:hypothetical protein